MSKLQDFLAWREAEIEREDSFPDHAGRKGQVGGSLPRHAGRANEISQKTGVQVQASSAPNFYNTFHATRDSVSERDRWRVDGTYSTNAYKHMECYNTGDGGSFAIHNGDIVSVCAQGDKAKKQYGGKQLLQAAVAAGGNKLDAFEGIAGFYLSCGFEPVSWTPFNIEYAPDGWREAHRDYGAEQEDVIFYRYTGNVIKGEEERKKYIEDFKKRVPPCTGENGYSEAQKMRDNVIKEGGR